MKILIIQNKMIGDVLTSGILFELIKAKHPHYELHYLINKKTYPVVENNPYIDAFVFTTDELEANTFTFLKWAYRLRKNKYDIIIDVYSKLSSNIITLLSRAKIKISYHKFYTTLIYTHNIKRKEIKANSKNLSVVQRQLLLEPIGIAYNPEIKYKIHLSEEENKNGERMLSSFKLNSEKLIMISVLGSSFNKSYPPHYMARIIDTTAEHTKGPILFNYTPSQKKEAYEIYDLCKPETQKLIELDLTANSLREFLVLLNQCKAIVGNEGGAINMAKGLNIKSFSIYSPWIDKASWAIFEDNKSNVSVHLKDFKPDLYSKPEKKYKEQSIEYYKLFSPNLFIDKLNIFLKTI